jgi:DNA-binding IclR family transcriptional regulator
MSENGGRAQNKLDEWAKYFKVVAAPVRLLILLALYSSDLLGRESHSLTFSEIRSVSGLPTNEALVYHLKQLENSDFIRKEAHKDEKSGRVYPLYHVGKQGKRFLEDLDLASILQKTMNEIRSDTRREDNRVS